jgi:quercetin dioxygenase-like cupin family protein
MQTLPTQALLQSGVTPMIPHMHLSKMLYAASAALVLAACADRPTESNTPSSTDNGAPTDPNFTAAVGFTSTLVGRGNLGTFHIQSKADRYDVELKSHDNTDIAVANIVVVPGGHSGWHYHPGPVLVVVKTGTITFYMGDDPSCSPQVHPAGSTFIEKGGMVGIARNEGTVEATVVATFFVPADSPLRIDAPAPGNCAF